MRAGEVHQPVVTLQGKAHRVERRPIGPGHQRTLVKGMEPLGIQPPRVVEAEPYVRPARGEGQVKAARAGAGSGLPGAVGHAAGAVQRTVDVDENETNHSILTHPECAMTAGPPT